MKRTKGFKSLKFRAIIGRFQVTSWAVKGLTCVVSVSMFSSTRRVPNIYSAVLAVLYVLTLCARFNCRFIFVNYAIHDCYRQSDTL